MKAFFVNLFCAFFMLWLAGCNSSSSTSNKDSFEEKLFVVNTVDNAEKLKEYLAYHDNIWPEVEAGFKKAGYGEVALYRFNDLLVMRIKFPKGSNLDEMGKLAESYSPKCVEWNELMNTYQQGVNGTAEGQKWVEVVPFYSFEKNAE